MKTRRFFSLFFLLVLMASLALTPASAADEESGVTPPELHCEAMLLVDANTGRMVYGKNEHEQMYPASLTKIMTALLVLEAVDSGQLSLDQQITATESAMEGLAADGSTAGIQAGEILTVEQLLQCMLIVSANEACNILAEQVSGSVDAFVDAMNAKAEALGCEDTHFVNATGLHDSQHYTTAWDLYLITTEAMKHEDFMRICDTARATIPATNLSEERNLYTTNYLIDTWRSLGYIYSNAHGIKTGSTDEAGHCLVSSATEGSLSFISVALGGPRVTLADGEIRTYSFFDTREMFKWAFDNFSYQTVLEEAELVKEVSVALSKVDHVSVHPASDVELLLPNGTDPASLERTAGPGEPPGRPHHGGAGAGHPHPPLPERRGAGHGGSAGLPRRGGLRPAGVRPERAELLRSDRREGGRHRAGGAGGGPGALEADGGPPALPLRPQRHPPQRRRRLPGPETEISANKDLGRCPRSLFAA